MKNLLKGLTRILPAYGVFPVIFSFVFNCLVYSGSRMIAGGWYHHNIETDVDRSIPFVPEFLVIYFGCYVFWAVNYILIARQDRRSVVIDELIALLHLLNKTLGCGIVA